MSRTTRGLRRIASFPSDAVTLYRDTRPIPGLRKPEVVQFPVNDICNSRCQMCFIWQQKKAKELTPAEVFRVFSDPVFDQVRGVGINGGEPTLRKDLAELVEAAADALPNLLHVSLISNAIQRNRVLDRIREIRKVTDENGLSLDVMISIDGVGEMHDRVRGKPGNFSSAVYVLEAIKAEQLATSLRIGCTITETNVAAGEELLEWAIENGIYARFRVAVAHNRLYNRGCVDEYEVKTDHLYPVLMLLDRLSREYEPEPRRQRFYRSLLEQLAYNAPRSAGCAWRNHGVTLLADGQLAYCAVESPELGSALEERPTNVYWANDHVRREILENKCAGCRHDYDGASDFAQELVDLTKTLPLAGKAGQAFRPLVRRASERLATAKELAQGMTSRSSLRASDRGDTLVLTGWYGTETIGDQAILGGIISTSRSVHDGPIVVSSLEPFITERTLRVLGLNESVSTVTYGEAQSLIIGGRARAVAMAGGPLMGTIPQTRLLARTHRDAHRRGIPTGLLGIGLGPLGGSLATHLIAQVLKRSDVVITRDDESAELAAHLGMGSVIAAADPALIWLGESATPAAPVEDDRPALALAIRRWPIHEYGAGEFTPDTRTRFEEALRDELETLETSFRFVPIAMGTVHVGGDDRRVLRELLGPGASPLTSLREFPTPNSVRLALLGCRYSLAMRYHAALFSVALGLPTVAIDYTGGGKLKALQTQFPRVRVIDPSELSSGDIESALGSAEPVPLTDVRRLRLSTDKALRAGLAQLLS
jgi:polysaccharide pyruvyl transferase WcaK-like protein/MoaA/NifB/PqqE/SkfB family radical SAM enzyme